MPANVKIVYEGDPTSAIKATEAVNKAVAALPATIKNVTAAVGKDFAVTLSGLQASIGTTTEQTKEFSLAMINLRDAGSAFTIIARQMKAAIDEALTSFMDIDKVIQQTAVLSTDLGDAVSQTMREDILSAVREMSVEFNQDIGTTAIALRELVAMGFSAEESIDILRAGAQGAVAGLGEMDDTAILLANTIRSFGLEIEDVTEVAAIFTYVGQRTNLTMEDFAVSMQFAGSVAGQMGFTLEETAAMLGIMRNAGLDASIAGTTLRQFLVRIQDPTTEARELMGELNVEFADANGNFLTMAEILSNVDIATRDMTEAQRSQIIATLFETRGQAAFNLTMAQGLDELTELTNAAGVYNDSQKAQAFLTDQTSKMLDFQSAAFQRAQKEAKITNQIFGEKLMPTQTLMIETSNKLTRSLVDMPGTMGNVNAFLISMGQAALDSSGKFFFLITSIQTASKSLRESLPKLKEYLSTLIHFGSATDTSRQSALRFGAALGSMATVYIGLNTMLAAFNAKSNEERILFSALTGLTWGLAIAQMAYALGVQMSIPVIGIAIAAAAAAGFAVYLASVNRAADEAKANAQHGALFMARPGRGTMVRAGEGADNEFFLPEPMLRHVVREELTDVLGRNNQVNNNDTLIVQIPPFHEVRESDVRKWARIYEDSKRNRGRSVGS